MLSHNKLFCNELVIRSNEFKLNNFKIKINDFEFELRACEIVIATPSGSTGYSLSLGGPINICDSLILNCTAPNRALFRPVILPSTCKLTIEAEKCSGWIDGIEYQGEKFIITKGDIYKVYVDDDYNQYSIISQIFQS